MAGERRTQLGEERKELKVWHSFCFTGLSLAQKKRGTTQLGWGGPAAAVLLGGPRLLFGPTRGCAVKHPHGGCGSRTPRPALLCAGGSPPGAAAPAASQRGPWQRSPGHPFISAHANNLEVPPLPPPHPEWDSWSPAAFLGAFFMWPCKVPWQSLLGLASRGPGRGREAAWRWLKPCQPKLSDSKAFSCPEQRADVASVIDLFRALLLLTQREKTGRGFNLSKWF